MTGCQKRCWVLVLEDMAGSSSVTIGPAAALLQAVLLAQLCCSIMQDSTWSQRAGSINAADVGHVVPACPVGQEWGHLPA